MKTHKIYTRLLVDVESRLVALEKQKSELLALLSVIQRILGGKPQIIRDDAKTAAQILGRLGGVKGGQARARALTPERRQEIAQKAANTRWAKNKEPNRTR